MKKKNIISICLSNWIISLVAFGPVLVLFIFMGLTTSYMAQLIGISMLCIELLWLISSAIYQLLQRKWLRGIMIISISIGGTLVAFITYAILSTMITMIDGDHFADYLKIPDNIEINQPIDLTYIIPIDDSIRNIEKNSPDFQLYNSFQPGIYEYDFWTSKIENGSIYLKVFEVTQEQALSTDRLPKTTLIKIYNPTDSILVFGTTSDFTIYEGDWEKPYAARFEVWFKPDNDGQERKLIEKVFKIEGWQH